MKRRRHHEGAEPDQRPAHSPPSQGILALQRSAGNRAVTGLLTRQGLAAPHRSAARHVAGVLTRQGVLALQRSVGNQAVTGMLARKEEDEPDTEPASVDLAGIGVIVITSWGLADHGAGGARVRREDDALTKLALTSPMAAHSPKLHKWAAEGKHIKSARIENRGFTFELSDAIILSYSVHEGSPGRTPDEHWTISGQKA